MSCRDFRELLSRISGPARGSDDQAALARHLEQCDDCARFARRWHELRRGLRRSPAVTPDAGFAARVVARLPAPADPLSWAALRLLPASVALVLALTGWCLLATPPPTTVADELAGGDLLTWVAAGEESGR